MNLDHTRDGVFMSKAELSKVKVIGDYVNLKISRSEAATKLNKSERTIQRYAKRFRQKNMLAFKHGNKGRAPINKTPKETIEQYVDLYKEKYKMFNFSHAFEKMNIEERLSKTISLSTFIRAPPRSTPKLHLNYP